jgi:translation initiation factor 4E
MWEDRFNRSGGRWSLNLNKSQRATELDKYWLYTVCLKKIFYLDLFS